MNPTMQQTLQQNLNQPQSNQGNMNVNNFQISRQAEYMAQQRVRGKKMRKKNLLEETK